MNEVPQASDRVLRSAFDHAPIGIALVSPEGKWLDVNRSLCRIVGYTRAELLNMTFQDITYPEDLHTDLSYVHDMLEKRRTHYRMEKRYIHKQGHLVWVQLSVTLLWSPDGKPELFVSQIEDITERKRMERLLQRAKDEAEAAARAKGAVLAMMSHEIRTPLNGILGFAHLLADTNLTQEQAEFLKSIRTGGESLLTIVNDVLDYSKIEAGKIELEDEPLSVEEIARSSVDMLRYRAAEKGIALRYEVLPGVPERVRGDLIRLRQILSNLLSNAVKFTEQGEVTLSVKQGTLKQRNDAVEFEVRDTGIGIPPDRIESLYEPFTQLDASIARRFGGTGLGLAICNRLTACMKGSFWLESELGKGTIAHLILPLRPANGTLPSDSHRQVAAGAARVSAPRIPELTPAAKSLRVLVAEDCEINQRFMKHLFKRLGVASVKLTNDGLDALEHFAREKFDLVLMDCQMPQLDGYDATRRMRDLERTNPHRPRTPIIALTASAMTEDRLKGLDAGMDDYLTKPIRPEVLAATLENTAEKRPKVET
jgi:two-component system sensor histidine kinase/response regulator